MERFVVFFYQQGLFLGLGARRLVERSISVIRRVNLFIYLQSHILGRGFNTITWHFQGLFDTSRVCLTVVVFFAPLNSILNIMYDFPTGDHTSVAYGIAYVCICCLYLSALGLMSQNMNNVNYTIAAVPYTNVERCYIFPWFSATKMSQNC